MGDRLSDAVVAEVADREGVDPLDLPPLFDVVDRDALDVLFTDTDGRHRSARTVFYYHGYEVTAYADGRVAVREASQANDTHNHGRSR